MPLSVYEGPINVKFNMVSKQVRDCVCITPSSLYTNLVLCIVLVSGLDRM